jgi:hypothetical protein
MKMKMMCYFTVLQFNCGGLFYYYACGIMLVVQYVTKKIMSENRKAITRADDTGVQ